MDAHNTQVNQEGHAASSKVKVYRFKRLGAVQDDESASEIYATRQAIERFEAEMIASTAMEVDKADLDGYGRYYPELHASRSADPPRSH